MCWAAAAILALAVVAVSWANATVPGHAPRIIVVLARASVTLGLVATILVLAVVAVIWASFTILIHAALIVVVLARALMALRLVFVGSDVMVVRPFVATTCMVVVMMAISLSATVVGRTVATWSIIIVVSVLVILFSTSTTVMVRVRVNATRSICAAMVVRITSNVYRGSTAIVFTAPRVKVHLATLVFTRMTTVSIGARTVW